MVPSNLKQKQHVIALSVSQKERKNDVKDGSNVVLAGSTLQDRMLQLLRYCGAFSWFESWAPPNEVIKISSLLIRPRKPGRPIIRNNIHDFHMCLVQQRWNLSAQSIANTPLDYTSTSKGGTIGS